MSGIFFAYYESRIHPDNKGETP